MYTDMLPYTQIMHTQICCHIFRYAAMYTNMLPHTQICCHIHRLWKKSASSTKHSTIKKIPIFSLRTFYNFRFEAVFISLSCSKWINKKKKNDLRGGRSWRILIGILNHRNRHTPPPPSTPHTPIHPQDQPCERALAPALRPLPFLFVCFLLCSNSQKNKKCEIRLSNSHFLFFWGGPPGRRLAPDVFFEFFREI